jgi:hypothetical protein
MKEKLNEGHYAEALDRCSTVNEIIELMLMRHPVIGQNKTLAKKIEKAQELVGEVYQKIGQKL